MTNRKFLSLLLALSMVFGTFIPSFAENDSVTVLPPRMAEKDKEPDNIVIMEDEKDTIPILNESEEGGTKEEELPNEQDVKDNAPLILEDRKEDNIVILPPIRNEKEEEKKEEEPQEETEKSEEPQEIKEEKKEVKVQILSKRDVKKPASEGEVNLVLLNDNPADVNEEVYDEKIRWKESDFNIEDDKIISLSGEGLLKAKINKKLVVPEMENITIIEKEAFKGLSLRSVEIPKNIKEIKDEAFKDNHLKSVKILGKGKEISKNAFNEELVKEYEKCEDEEFLYEYEDEEDELEIGDEIIGDAVGAVAPDDVSLYTFNGTTITGLSEKGKTYYNDNHDMVLPGKSPQGKVITKIEDRAFYNSWGSYRLTSVDFSNCTSLTGIGSEAFRNNELTSLDLSGCKSLSGIDYNAFLGNQLTNLNLSGCTNLKFIGGSAFNNNQLASLDLSGCTSLISIDGSAFEDNQITSLDLSGCTSLESIDSEAFNHNQITNLNLSGCVNLTSIGFWAFNQNQLTSLDLSGCINLTSIGRVAFGYSRLKTAKIPLSLKNLADDAFYRNPGNNDKKQVYLYTPDKTNPNNLKDTESHLINPVEKVSPDDVSLYTFSGTTITGLSEKGKIYYATNHDMVLPGKNPQGQSITAIGEGAFDNNGNDYKLTSVDFSNCTSLTSIGRYAFMLNQLTSIDLSECESLKNIDGDAFSKNQLTSVDLSGCKNLTSIGAYAFTRNQLTSVNLSGCTSLMSIGSSAFSKNNLTSLDLSKCRNLKTIDSLAFNNNQLTEINLSGCTSLTSIARFAFSSNQIKTAKIPLSLKTLVDDAFSSNPGNNDKKQVYLYTPDKTNPNNLKDTDSHLINPIESSDDVSLYTFNGTTITGLSERGKKYFETNHDMILPGKNPQGELITAIGKNAFNNNGNGYGLTSVDLSNCTNLKNIENYSFCYNQLTNLDLSGCRNLVSIDDSAFRNNQLTTLDLSGCANLISIGNFAFCNNQLTILDLSKCTSLKNIGIGAFANNQFTTLDLSRCTSLTNMGDYAFNSNKLASLDLSGCTNLTSIGEYAFGSNQLKTSKIPLNLTTLADDAFMENPGSNDKKQVYLYTPDYTNPNNLKDSDYHLINPVEGSDDVSLYTFSGTTITGLSERGKKYFETHHDMKLPGKNPQGQTITEIGAGAFDNNRNGYGLTSVDFKNLPHLISIVGAAFKGNQLTSLDLSGCKSLKFIGDEAFYKNQLTSLDLSGCTNLERIGTGVFSYNQLTNLDLSGCKSLTSIYPSAFSNNKLTNLNLSGCTNLTNIGGSAFSKNQLTSLDLSECTSLERISMGAFSNNKLTNLNLSGCTNLTNIGRGAFAMNQFASLDLSEYTSLTSIESFAFAGNQLKTAKIPLSLKTLADDAFTRNPGSNDKKQVYLFTPDYTNPNNLKDTNFHLINPITGPDDVTLYTFEGSTITGLTERGKKYFKENPNIKLPGKNPQGEPITAIADNAFSPEEYDENYPVFKSIDFSNSSSLVTIGKSAFGNYVFDKIDLSPCTNLQEIGDGAFALPEDIDSPDDKKIEVSFRGLKNLKRIGRGAFAGPDIGDRYRSFDFSGCTGLEIIDDWAFTANSFRNLDLSDCSNLKNIGKFAFINTGLQNINLSNCTSLTKIDKLAFSGNGLLQNLDMSNCSSLEIIEESAFSNTALKTVDLSTCTNLKTVGVNAFGYSRITEGKIPLSLTTLADDAFKGNPGNNDKKQVYLYTPDYTNPNNLLDTDYHLINPITGSNDVTLYTFDGTTITGLTDRGKKYFAENHEMILPGKTPDGQDVTAIGEKAFYNNGSGYGLTKVDLNSLKELDGIGRNAFSNNKIETVDLYDCPNLLFIWDEAFSNNQLKTFITPQSLTRLEDDVFKGNIGNNDKKQVFVYTPTRKNPKGFLSNEWQIIDPIKITIKKVDAKGNPIEGVEFSVRYGPYENVSETPNSLKNSNELELNKISADGLMVSDEKLDIVRVMDSGGGWSSGSGSGFIKPGDIKLKATTDKNGTAEITIPYGPYYLVEDKTVPGYSVNKKVTIIDETLDGKTITYTDYEVSIEVPKTGTLGTLPYILLALILVGGAYVVLRKKKEEEK